MANMQPSPLNLDTQKLAAEAKVKAYLEDIKKVDEKHGFTHSAQLVQTKHGLFAVPDVIVLQKATEDKSVKSN